MKTVTIQTLSEISHGDRTPFTNDFGKHADNIYKSLVKTDENFCLFAQVINNNADTLGESLKSILRVNRRAKVGIALGAAALGLGYLLSRKVNTMNEEIEELKARLEEIETVESQWNKLLDKDISLDDAHVEEE
jgi:hypothetical protein